MEKLTIKDLEQLICWRREVEHLEKRIEKMNKAARRITTESVRGSDDVFPYAGRSFVIRGLDYMSEQKAKKLYDILFQRRLRLGDRIVEVEEMIDGIEDSKLRQIITLHYIDGKSWNVTATKVYGYPCGDTARKKVTRFFEKI